MSRQTLMTWAAMAVLVVAVFLAAKGMTGRSTPLLVVGAALLIGSRIRRKAR